MKQSTLLSIIFILLAMLIFTGYRLVETINNTEQYKHTTASNYDVEVMLPEEYDLITTKDTLIGYYNKDQNVLYIAYNNKRNQITPINSQKVKHQRHGE